MSMADRFLRALTARGFRSIPDFARRTGIPASSLYEIKRGTHPKDGRMAAICEALKVSEGLLAYGPDDKFDAELEGAEPDHLGPIRKSSESRSGLLVPYELDTWAEANGRLRGPIALKYEALADPAMSKVARGVKHEQLHRAEPGEKRTVEITRIPTGSDLIEVRRPINGMGPGRWAAVVVPSDRPISSAEDVVLAVRGPDFTADWLKNPDAGKNKAFLMRYRELQGAVTLWPLDDNPNEMENAAKGWKVVGAVVDWKKV